MLLFVCPIKRLAALNVEKNIKKMLVGCRGNVYLCGAKKWKEVG